MPFTPPPNDQILAAFPTITALNPLDGGGFKVVYRAQIAGRMEVFKLVGLPPAGTNDDEQAYRRECTGRIRREVEILGRCQRPELVRLGSLPPQVVTIGGTEFVGYSEEFLDGPNLWTLLRARGPKPAEAEARVLLLTLLRAISELWAMRIIHRDIKPHNIIKLPDPDRPFVLLDLGIAYGLLETGLTRDTQFIPGTARYLAPEMLRPGFRQNLDFRSDLYSAALTVFEYSAQLHPLARTRDDLIQTLSRIAQQAPRALKAERPDFSDGFCRIIDQMLKKKPALRPANLDRLLHSIENTP